MSGLEGIPSALTITVSVPRLLASNFSAHRKYEYSLRSFKLVLPNKPLVLNHFEHFLAHVRPSTYLNDVQVDVLSFLKSAAIAWRPWIAPM